MTYPDNHPEVRENVVTVTTPDGAVQYMPREMWDKAVVDRDEYRRVLAMISVWRLSSGVRDPHLDRLLGNVGETYDTARAMAGLIDDWSHEQQEQ